MDVFLDEMYKKNVSNDIRQRNREKKLLRESATQDSSSVTKDKKSQSHKKREVENIVQDVFDFTVTSAPEKNRRFTDNGMHPLASSNAVTETQLRGREKESCALDATLGPHEAAMPVAAVCEPGTI